MDKFHDGRSFHGLDEFHLYNQSVVLVAELRTRAGVTVFDASSMKLVRLKP